MAVCDVFTCGVSNPKKGAVHLGRKLKARDFTATVLDRITCPYRIPSLNPKIGGKKFRQKIDYKDFIKL